MNQCQRCERTMASVRRCEWTMSGHFCRGHLCVSCRKMYRATTAILAYAPRTVDTSGPVAGPEPMVCGDHLPHPMTAEDAEAYKEITNRVARLTSNGWKY